MVVKQKDLLFVIFFFSLILVSVEGASSIDYQNQSSWADPLCKAGVQQSPININTKSLNFCPNITFNLKYQCMATSFIPKTGDISYTVQSAGSSYVGVNDQIGLINPKIRLYSSANYHFHVPSEHTINGVQYPLEMHIVHLPIDNANGTNTSFTGQFASFNTSGYNNQTLFASAVGYLFYPSDSAQAIDLNFRTDSNGVAQVNHLELFGCTTNRFFYHYRGSLTYPPCTQSVDWFVYREPLPLKTSNYNAIKSAINSGKANARVVQNINNRKVYLAGGACKSP